MRKILLSSLALLLTAGSAFARDPFIPWKTLPERQDASSFERDVLTSVVFGKESQAIGDTYLERFLGEGTVSMYILPSLEIGTESTDNFYLLNATKQSMFEHNYKPEVIVQLDVHDLISDITLQADYHMFDGFSDENYVDYLASWEGQYFIKGTGNATNNLFPFVRYQKTHYTRFGTDTIFAPVPKVFRNPTEAVSEEKLTADLKWVYGFDDGRTYLEVGAFSDFTWYHVPTVLGDKLEGDQDNASYTGRLGLRYDLTGLTPVITRAVPFANMEVNYIDFFDKVNQFGDKKSNIGYLPLVGTQIFGATPLGNGFMEFAVGYITRHYSQGGSSKQDTSRLRYRAIVALELDKRTNVSFFTDTVVTGSFFPEFDIFWNNAIVQPFVLSVNYEVLQERNKYDEPKLDVDLSFTRSQLEISGKPGLPFPIPFGKVFYLDEIAAGVGYANNLFSVNAKYSFTRFAGLEFFPGLDHIQFFGVDVKLRF